MDRATRCRDRARDRRAGARGLRQHRDRDRHRSSAVTPSDRNSNASIVAAVDAAHQASIAGAIAQAREYAQQYATAVGLTLGSVLSISDAGNGGAFYGPGPFFGPFGPNQYCGTFRRPIRTGPKGHRHITGFKKVHRCFVPPFASVSLTVTYQAS